MLRVKTQISHNKI